MKTNLILKKVSIFLVLSALLLIIFQNCRKDECAYENTINPPANAGCNMTNYINISTGIDAAGNAIAPGTGVVDPFWRVLNNPPLISCFDPITNTINGNAYLINSGNTPSTAWINQVGVTAIAPVNLGTTSGFSCNNATNSAGETVPFIFERSFCVLKSTKVDFSFSFKGDDRLTLQLINNNTNTVVATSSVFSYPNPASVWNVTGLAIPAGSYSLRALLVNTGSVILGFTVKGNMTTSNGELAISNNVNGCCENNTISVLNILEETCNSKFDAVDTVGSGFTFTVKNSSGVVVGTRVTDVNGNIFFSGLANGTYTVTMTPQSGWNPTNPTGGTATVTLNNNTVQILNFYNCH